MRDGLPLPGSTPEMVMSRLTHLVFGPLHLDRVHTVLDYHGLVGHPAEQLAVLAARHKVSSRTVSARVRHVRAAAAGHPVDPRVTTTAARESTPADDHLGRVRIATTLHLPLPPPAAGASIAIPPSDLRAGHTGIRLLATVGPLDVGTLCTAVGRSRRFRIRDPLSPMQLAAALGALGATRDYDGRWQSPAGVVVPTRYRSILDAAAGTTDAEITRRQMIGLLTVAGYSRNSAVGRMSSSHPLFVRTGPNRYRIVGSNQRDHVPAGTV